MPAERLIEYPGYLFQNLQPKTAPYHFLLKYLTDYPPAGYKFVEEPQLRKLFKYPTAFFDEWKARHLANGGHPDDFQKILDRTVNSPSNLPHIHEMSWLPDRPCMISPFPIFCQQPWLIEIEDWVTLFYWWFHNGATAQFNPRSEPFMPLMRAFFELPSFCGVVTHIKQTIQSLTVLFPSLHDKFLYVPLGVPSFEPNKLEVGHGKPVNFLFHGSFNHTGVHFALRGGFYFLEAFRRVEHLYPDIRYTIIYDEEGFRHTPPAYYWYVKNHPKIRHINKYLKREEFNQEMQSASVFVIPAYRTHSMSIGQAMSRGIPILTSNGWGINEFVAEGVNGWVADFAPQTNSWVDLDGIFREQYEPPFSLQETIVQNLCEKIHEVMQNRDEIVKRGVAALEFHRQNLTIERRNVCLKPVLNRLFKGVECE